MVSFKQWLSTLWRREEERARGRTEARREREQASRSRERAEALERAEQQRARERAQMFEREERIHNCPNQGKTPEYDHFGWKRFGWCLTGFDGDRLHAYCRECGWDVLDFGGSYNGLLAASGAYANNIPVHPTYE